MKVRPAAVADMFYPNDVDKLQTWFRTWMHEGSDSVLPQLPRALIVPHAGYVYSGKLAASAYQHWLGADDEIKTVVIIGPAHRVPFMGVTTIGVDSVATPLGGLAIDTALRDDLLGRFDWLTVSDAAQAEEHSIEVQFPLLKHALPEVKVVPLLNGQMNPLDETVLLNYLWQQPNIYFVISSDLSHFHSYDRANQLDHGTADLINRFEWSLLTGDLACGFKGIQALLALKAERNLVIKQLGQINSGDTAGDKQRVVGYGAWALWEKQEMLSEQEKKALLQLAKRSILNGLQQGAPLQARLESSNADNELAKAHATFVTLEKAGQLRGCIGSLQAARPLIEDVAINAFNAAYKDPRFPAVTEDELLSLHVSISVLTPAEKMEHCETLDSFLEQLHPNQDGIILSDGVRRATFLPSVWEQLPDKREFTQHLMQKAGIRAWSDQMQCERYHTIKFAADWNQIP